MRRPRASRRSGLLGKEQPWQPGLLGGRLTGPLTGVRIRSAGRLPRRLGRRRLDRVGRQGDSSGRIELCGYVSRTYSTTTWTRMRRGPDATPGPSRSPRGGDPAAWRHGGAGAGRAGERPRGGHGYRDRMGSRLVVLVSGEGTLLQHLMDECAVGRVRAQIAAVGADRDGTLAIRRAEAAGIPTFVCRLGDYPDRAAWDEALTAACARYQPDLVISAGFLKLFGDRFLAEFSGRCINTHPALLPSFPGLHGVRDALAHGVKVTGCTVFLVDAGLDSGPVIAQQAVPVHADDDEAALHARIKEAERGLLARTVADMISRGWTVSGRTVRIGGGRSDEP